VVAVPMKQPGRALLLLQKQHLLLLLEGQL
jgi:hypothetical protein